MPRRPRQRAIWLIATLTATMASPATAADTEGLFAVKGVGALNCAAYVRAAESGSNELAQYSGYLAGYVSAYNEHLADTFDLLPWQSMETLMLVMLRRCRDVPATSFGTAVTGMARFFDDHKLERLERRVRIGAGENAFEVHESVAADLRAALERHGYPVDDLYASLQQYRRDRKLPPSADDIQTALLSVLYTSGNR